MDRADTFACSPHQINPSWVLRLPVGNLLLLSKSSRLLNRFGNPNPRSVGKSSPLPQL